MNLRTRLSLRFAVIAGAALLWSLVSLAGREFNETVPADTVELLASDSDEEIAKGEQLVAENGHQYIRELLDNIRSGDWGSKRKAAAELGIIISPWLRGKEAGARFYSFASFEAPRRPVDRVSHMAEAAEIRQTLQTVIPDLLKVAEVRPQELHQFVSMLRTLCETLGEVANDETMDWTIALLPTIQSPLLAEPLLALADSYLGIRPIFRSAGMCGNSSHAERESFRLSQELALREASRILGACWEEVRPMNPEARVAFAIKSWRDYFVPLQQSYSGHYIHNGWLFQEMEPLIRLGAPAVKALRAQQNLENELEVKGVWEAVIATITGREDPGMVRALFDAKHQHLELACEIVVGARSQDWLPQMDELQTRVGFDCGTASKAIATCHRYEGIPSLRRGFAANRNNFQADCAINELEVRKTSGPPRGMRR